MSRREHKCPKWVNPYLFNYRQQVGSDQRLPKVQVCLLTGGKGCVQKTKTVNLVEMQMNDLRDFGMK